MFFDSLHVPTQDFTIKHPSSRQSHTERKKTHHAQVMLFNRNCKVTACATGSKREQSEIFRVKSWFPSLLYKVSFEFSTFEYTVIFKSSTPYNRSSFENSHERHTKPERCSILLSGYVCSRDSAH